MKIPKFNYMISNAGHGGRQSSITGLAGSVLLLGLFGFGVLMECLQGLGSTRQPEVADALANLLGIVLGLGLARLALAGWCVRAERLLAREAGDGR